MEIQFGPAPPVSINEPFTGNLKGKRKKPKAKKGRYTTPYQGLWVGLHRAKVCTVEKK
jgi:hypothetical protein